MRRPASGSWWSEQILDTVPNERFCARDLKESKSDRTHPAAFLCAKRSLQSKVIGQICVFFDANGKGCTKGKHEKRFPFWRERGTAGLWLVGESRMLYVGIQESVLLYV